MFYSWDPGFSLGTYKGTVFSQIFFLMCPCLKNNFRQNFMKIYYKKAGKTAFLICEIQIFGIIFSQSN